MVPNSIRRLNAATGADLTFESPAEDMARFDRLPAAVRQRVAAATIKIACRSLEGHVAWSRRTGQGSQATVRQIDRLETNEIAVFAGEHRGQFGYVLPHVAAEASILRPTERHKRRPIR